MILEESELVQRLRRGDDDAFSRLVAEHDAKMRRVARLQGVNAAVADEVVQETWLGVIRGISAFEGRSSLETWIFRILVHLARTRAQRERRGATLHMALSTASGTDAEPATSPERSLLNQELRAQLRTVIDSLPTNLRTVLWLRDVEGWSSEAVCNALAIQETNQRVLLHRARRRARAALEPYFDLNASAR